MEILIRLLRMFKEGLTSRGVRAQSLDYSDRSVGLRCPDAPAGIYIQDDGTVQLYSATSKIIATLSGDLDLEAHRTRIMGMRIDISPDQIGSYTLMGRTINQKVFEGVSRVLHSSDISGLDNIKLLTPESRALESGEIINTVDLTSLISTDETYPEVEAVEPTPLLQARLVFDELNIPIPEAFR